ncbi:unnamed protein product [Blepharisma stoltei]|uniref:Uncharacterized protein n=1 Tax=Blepharisma stoltei TaxID=1481888 RepID=A0AAU9JRV8_9CILI|nr:unnamed protein product [Blepharisma stoltei]
MRIEILIVYIKKELIYQTLKMQPCKKHKKPLVRFTSQQKMRILKELKHKTLEKSLKISNTETTMNIAKAPLKRLIMSGKSLLPNLDKQRLDLSSQSKILTSPLSTSHSSKLLMSPKEFSFCFTSKSYVKSHNDHQNIDNILEYRNLSSRKLTNIKNISCTAVENIREKYKKEIKERIKLQNYQNSSLNSSFKNLQKDESSISTNRANIKKLDSSLNLFCKIPPKDESILSGTTTRELSSKRIAIEESPISKSDEKRMKFLLPSKSISSNIPTEIQNKFQQLNPLFEKPNTETVSDIEKILNEKKWIRNESNKIDEAMESASVEEANKSIHKDIERIFYPEVTKFPQKTEMPKVRSPDFKKRPFGLHESYNHDESLKHSFIILGTRNMGKNSNCKTKKYPEKDKQKSYDLDDYKMLSFYLEICDKNIS